MSSSRARIRVGAIQSEPVWLDLHGSVDKTIRLIKDAAASGINVLGFPEVWIPGYPWCIWTSSVVSNVGMMHSYMANSLVKDSSEMRRIQEAVKEAGIFVVLGYSERDGDSLYMAQSFISPEGEIVLHRRKIKPTHVERAVWGDGQADSLGMVVESPFGRIGALDCWEHFQPLLRYYEYSQRVQIHVASWPPAFPMTDPEKQPWVYHLTGEACSRASQFMAMEGQTFVLVASQIITEENLERNNLVGNTVIKTPGGGFSMIFGPDGRPLCEPVGDGVEAIVTADIDLGDIDYAKTFIDTVGHSSRPDLLSLLVNAEAAKHVTVMK